MKIYFYEPSPLVRAVHADHARHRLGPHLRYLAGLQRALASFATEDPSQADYFFVPVSLVAFQFPGAGGRFTDPWPYIGALPHLGRKPHLLFAPGDFGQRRRAAYEIDIPGRAYPQAYPWLDERFVLLAFESTADLAPQDIALFPYVLEPESLIDRLRRALTLRRCASRDLLYSFAGVTHYPELDPAQIRGGPLRALEGVNGDSFVGTLRAARRRYGRLRGSDVGMLRRSVFTLCPAGFGRWTYRFVQAAAHGSIPVLLSDGYLKPMAKRVDWDAFSLTVPEAEVSTVPARLRAMPEAEIARYQRALAAAAPRLTADGLHDMLVRELQGRVAR